MKFALSMNPAIADPPKKVVKSYKHIECGHDLRQTHTEGLWFCSKCLKSGYLVRAK